METQSRKSWLYHQNQVDIQGKLLALILMAVLASFSETHTIAYATESTMDDVAVVDPKLVVLTDSSEYSPGDEVLISGTIASDILTPGQSVVLLVHDPLEAIIRSDLVLPYSNGSFWYEMPTGGELMRYSGEYTIVATYAGEYRAETTFDFTGSFDIEDGCATFGCVYELYLNNRTYEIQYRIFGYIQNVSVNVEAKSLEIDAEVDRRTSPMEISLPRDLIDAVYLDQNGVSRGGNFSVLINGLNAEEVMEVDPPDQLDHRQLHIEMLTEGENSVRITGTRVIPEFGALVLVVMVVASASIILVSRNKYRSDGF